MLLCIFIYCMTVCIIKGKHTEGRKTGRRENDGTGLNLGYKCVNCIKSTYVYLIKKIKYLLHVDLLVGLTYYTEVLLHYAFVHVYNYEIMFLFIILIFWGIIIWFKKKTSFQFTAYLGSF